MTAPGPVTLILLLLLLLLLLLAVRMFARAGWAGRLMPAAATITTRMLPQASTTHADFVRACTVRSLSFRGDQRRAQKARDAGRHEPARKESDLSGRHLRQIRPPDRRRARTARQPQQNQNHKDDHSSTSSTLHTAPAAPAARAAASATARVRAAP